jgi:hypothetical protein
MFDWRRIRHIPAIGKQNERQILIQLDIGVYRFDALVRRAPSFCNVAPVTTCSLHRCSIDGRQQARAHASRDPLSAGAHYEPEDAPRVPLIVVVK